MNVGPRAPGYPIIPAGKLIGRWSESVSMQYGITCDAKMNNWNQPASV
jgi:hypothetical protein